MPKFRFGIIAGWIQAGATSSSGALPGDGTLWKGPKQEVLDGLDRCPGSFFCGTVVPAFAASNPHIIFAISSRRTNGAGGSKISVRGFWY